jgi:hypothetical protein
VKEPHHDDDVGRIIELSLHSAASSQLHVLR